MPKKFSATKDLNCFSASKIDQPWLCCYLTSVNSRKHNVGCNKPVLSEVEGRSALHRMFLVAAVKPRYMRLTAKFYVRGGIFTNVVAEHRKPGWKPLPVVDLERFKGQSNIRG